jgi:hypothetical protein
MHQNRDSHVLPEAPDFIRKLALFQQQILTFFINHTPESLRSSFQAFLKCLVCCCIFIFTFITEKLFETISSTMNKIFTKIFILVICLLTMFQLYSSFSTLVGFDSINHDELNSPTSLVDVKADSTSGHRKSISTMHDNETSSKKGDKDAERYGGGIDLTHTAAWRDATLRRRSSHPWPQVDNRIAQTIQEGIGIIPQNVSWEQEKSKDGKLFYIWNSSRYEAPPKGLATVVTAYYDLKSKHPIQQYAGWFQKMLSATDPMIIFIDHTQFWGIDWLEYVKVRKKEGCCCRLTGFLCRQSRALVDIHFLLCCTNDSC